MPEKTTVYLAGKITGDPYYYTKFYDAARMLEAAGFSVVNPAMLPPTGFEYEAYMRMSSAMQCECKAACFLPDWTESEGAMHEHGRAVAREMDIFYFAEWLAAHEVLSAERTGKIACKCFACKKISVYPESRCDGQSCAHCGGHVAKIGHAKAGVKIGAQ